MDEWYGSDCYKLTTNTTTKSLSRDYDNVA
jgi:hypothetical protein